MHFQVRRMYKKTPFLYGLLYYCIALLELRIESLLLLRYSSFPTLLNCHCIVIAFTTQVFELNLCQSKGGLLERRSSFLCSTFIDRQSYWHFRCIRKLNQTFNGMSPEFKRVRTLQCLRINFSPTKWIYILITYWFIFSGKSLKMVATYHNKIYLVLAALLQGKKMT